MKTIFVLAVLGLVSLITAQNVTVAVARVRGTQNDPTIIGYVTFTPADGGNVTISINVTGITQNLGSMHGVHIHQFGDLTTNDGNSVGAHWATNGMNHGCPEINGTSRHIGDTGNWMVQSDGTLVGSKTLDLIGLMGGVNSVVGLAVIIHNATDNCATVASSGARLAQGVIGVAGPSFYGGNQNLAYPSPSYPSASGIAQAVCVLQPASNQAAGVAGPTGVVWFNQMANGQVEVSAVINGLADSSKMRGFHIHQWGDLRNADATSAGPHWTGDYLDTTVVHGIPLLGQPNRPHHMGDMGNIFSYENGVASYYNVFDTFTIFGANSILGRAIVVHNNTDDCTNTNNNGNAGPRIAMCVIGAANPAFGGNRTQLTTVPSTQNVANCPAMTTGFSTTDAPMMTSATSTTGVPMVTSASSSTAALVNTTSTTSGAFAVCASLVLAFAMIFA